MTSLGNGLSVLLVDDEPLIGLDLCDLLIEAGYNVIGPAATMPIAVSLLDRYMPQMAVIDVKLRDGLCLDLARQLRRRKVPFIVHTGYPRDCLDAIELREAPRLEKPVTPLELLSALRELSAASVQDGCSPVVSDKTAFA